jgi:hypothetical protein
MPDQPLDSELNLRGIVGVGLILIIITAAVTALMWWMSLGLRAHAAADDPAPPALLEARTQEAPSGPRLQSDPIGDLKKMRAEESAVLDHSEWIDQSSATARLAIDTALDIVGSNGELPDLNALASTAEDSP